MSLVLVVKFELWLVLPASSEYMVCLRDLTYGTCH
jgi:hypothetical protein